MPINIPISVYLYIYVYISLFVYISLIIRISLLDNRHLVCLVSCFIPQGPRKIPEYSR